MAMKKRTRKIELFGPARAETVCWTFFRGSRPTAIHVQPLRGWPEAGAGGKRWVGKWANLGKGGLMVGKRTGFSHLETALTRLFPLDSTQVVDFPHMSQLRVFWLRVEGGGGQWTVDNWQWIANSGNESNRTNGTNLARSMCKALRIVAGKSAKFHESARKSTKVRTDQTRGYAIVRLNP